MKQKSILWVVIILIIVIIGFSTSSKKQNSNLNIENNVTEENLSDTKMEGEGVMTEDEMVKSDQELGDTIEETDKMSGVGSYEDYDESKIVRAADGDVVLFFHASWCPTCRSLDKNISADLENIPAGVSILKVDYDANKDLRKKYGVKYQHTLVQVDEDGNLVKLWGGSSTLSEVINNIS